MYSFRLTFEVKELSNKDGTWFVPVCRINRSENDAEKLILLEDLARDFDSRGEEAVKGEDGNGQEEYRGQETSEGQDGPPR